LQEALVTDNPINQPFTLLVADDDPIIRDVVDVTLRSYGYRLLFAATGREACSVLDRERVDLALVDLLMPETSGFDVIAYCRRHDDLTRLPIIVMTAATEAELCDRAFDLGATTYVHKPLHWALFTHTIWYVLRNEARETELRQLKARFGLPTKAPAPLLR
jgi:DNA-binding response OmpR family regulator